MSVFSTAGGESRRVPLRPDGLPPKMGRRACGGILVLAETSSRHRLGDNDQNPSRPSILFLWRSTMRRASFGFLVGGVLLMTIGAIASAGEAKDEAIKKDRKRIEGTWRAVVLVVNGNKFSEENAKALTV